MSNRTSIIELIETRFEIQNKCKSMKNPVLGGTLGMIANMFAALVDFGASEECIRAPWARLGGVVGASRRRLGRILGCLGSVLA